MNITPQALWAQYQRAVQLWPWFGDIERAHGLPPCLLYAEGSRETGLVAAYAEGKVHADGTGWGLFGADQNWNDLDLPAFAHDPRAQAELCATSLARNYRARGTWVDAVNAYGPAWARGYTPDSYGPDVLARAEFLASQTRSAAPMEFWSRDDWGANDPDATPTAAPGMTRGIGVHWLGEGRGPTQHADCPAKMREVQAFHMGPQRNWNDFAYNAGACSHGAVFAGRGPYTRNAANGGESFQGYDANAGWAAILYLAGTDGPPLTQAGMDAINDAAVYLGPADGAWYGHTDFLSTECPGDELYAWAHGGHPRGTQVPPPIPTPAPPKEDVMVIVNGPPEVGGGIYCSDGDRLWGVPSEAWLQTYFFSGIYPHGGDISRELFFTHRDRDGQYRNPGVGLAEMEAEGVLDVNGNPVRTLAELATASVHVEAGQH